MVGTVNHPSQGWGSEAEQNDFLKITGQGFPCCPEGSGCGLFTATPCSNGSGTAREEGEEGLRPQTTPGLWILTVRTVDYLT